MVIFWTRVIYQHDQSYFQQCKQSLIKFYYDNIILFIDKISFQVTVNNDANINSWIAENCWTMMTTSSEKKSDCFCSVHGMAHLNVYFSVTRMSFISTKGYIYLSIDFDLKYVVTFDTSWFYNFKHFINAPARKASKCLYSDKIVSFFDKISGNSENIRIMSSPASVAQNWTLSSFPF